MKLSQKHIDHLFTFVKGKYVHYVDVQYEIVDHLATAIEEEMEQNPQLSFEKALANVYSRFPVTGFTEWMREKEKNLSKYWRKKVFSFFISYFTIPKIIGTGLLFMIIFYSFTFIYYPTQVWQFLAFVYSIYALYSMNKKLKITNEERSKYLVVVTHIGISAGLPLSILIGSLSNLSFEASKQYSDGTILIFSIFFVLIFIFNHAMITAFPSMIKEELEKKYDHLGLHKKMD